MLARPPGKQIFLNAPMDQRVAHLARGPSRATITSKLAVWDPLIREIGRRLEST